MSAGSTSRIGRVVAGILLALAAPLVYAALFDRAWSRSSGAPAFALLAAGVVLALSAWPTDRRWWVRALALAPAAFAALCAWAFFEATRLPAPAAIALERAPGFRLPDEDGRDVDLDETRARGPVMLVFFRGPW